MSDTPDVIVKHTTGFVTQLFKKQPDGSLICTEQCFTAGDSDYEDDAGNVLVPDDDFDTNKEVYQPFEMVQPTHRPFPDP